MSQDVRRLKKMTAI